MYIKMLLNRILIATVIVVFGLIIAFFATLPKKKGRWVAVGRGTTETDQWYTTYSDDGKKWYKSEVNFVNTFSPAYGVAYGKNGWVTVGRGDETDGNITNPGIAYSDNLEKPWILSSLESDGFSKIGYGVAYSSKQDLWVAVGGDGSTEREKHILWSTDRILWNKSDSSGDKLNLGNGVAYGKDKWVAVGVGSTGSPATGRENIMYSSDGKKWTATSDGACFGAQGYSVAYSSEQDLWVAGGRGMVHTGNSITFGTCYTNILYSSNGETWFESDNTGDYIVEYVRGVAYSSKQDRWVCTGGFNEVVDSSKTIVMWSDDGMCWVKAHTVPDQFAQGNSVAYSEQQDLWIIGGVQDPSTDVGMIHSKDGKSWSLTGFTGDWLKQVRGVAFGFA